MIKVNVFTFNPFQENTYIVSNEKGETIIIDPGCYFSAEQTTLQSFLTHWGLKPVQLLQTHCHLDHVFGTKWVSDTYNLVPFIHSKEEELFKNAGKVGINYGLPFENYPGNLNYLKEGDIIKLGTDELKVLFTPGHSPGSVSFYCEAQNLVFSGDVLFLEGVGRTDTPGASHEQLKDSIYKQLFTLPDDTVVYPGHGRHTSIGYEKQNNPFLVS